MAVTKNDAKQNPGTAEGDQSRLSGLPRRFVNDKLLTADKAAEALTQSRRQRLPFVSYLVQEKIVSAAVIAETASNEFGTPVFDLASLNIDHAPLSMVSEKLLRQNHAVPLFRRGPTLFVAVSDPTNIGAIDEFRFNTGLNTEAILVHEDRLTALIEKAADESDDSMEGLTDADLDNLEVTGGEEEDEDAGLMGKAGDDAPVVRFVNKVLLDAINKGASDIHFEPYEKVYRVRLRSDGVLKQLASPPVGLGPRIAARVKVMSRLDIAERRIPQDGRMKLNLSRNKAIDFRVNTCPTLYGEKIVMRILDPASAQLGIDALGFEPLMKKQILEAIHRPWGMTLVTGPTGSGKTVSLYTCLNILNTDDRNISTAEDPVEIQVKGINQVNVNPKAGFTFPDALRAFLRQDPDIIMVGEIRDLETAEIAVKAAQTGHMVLSTLHTNDAPQTVTRLANMGVPPFNIASAVTLIIAQRLGRRVCKGCREAVEIPAEALMQEGFTEDEIPDITLFRAHPEGCSECSAGYKGRIGLYQVMPISLDMQNIILAGGNAREIAEQSAKEGVGTIRRCGLNRVKDGTTTLDEINRVTTE